MQGSGSTFPTLRGSFCDRLNDIIYFLIAYCKLYKWDSTESWYWEEIWQAFPETCELKIDQAHAWKVVRTGCVFYIFSIVAGVIITMIQCHQIYVVFSWAVKEGIPEGYFRAQIFGPWQAGQSMKRMSPNFQGTSELNQLLAVIYLCRLEHRSCSSSIGKPHTVVEDLRHAFKIEA